MATNAATEHWEDAATFSDLAWHLHPMHPHEYCGGCGVQASSCHPDQCCTDVQDRLGFMEGVCGLCPTRKLTGQVQP